MGEVNLKDGENGRSSKVTRVWASDRHSKSTSTIRVLYVNKVRHESQSTAGSGPACTSVCCPSEATLRGCLGISESPPIDFSLPVPCANGSLHVQASEEATCTRIMYATLIIWGPAGAGVVQCWFQVLEKSSTSTLSVTSNIG